MPQSSLKWRWIIMLLILAACAPSAAPTPIPTLVPSSTPTLEASQTPLPTLTETPPDPTQEPTVVMEITQLAGIGDAPPLEMNFPPGWGYRYDNYALPDVDGMRSVPIAYYEGPVTGGTGKILIFWAFPNMVDPFTQPGEPVADADLWSDGLRLFRLAMVDRGCNSGTDLQRTYRIGNLSASGTQFSIVDCPESPDTRGWFAGVQVKGINFIFFVYAEPIEAMAEADDELQAILDTAVFRVPDE
jgi:hypothetical protein